jgi:hypothetical protein
VKRRGGGNVGIGGLSTGGGLGGAGRRGGSQAVTRTMHSATAHPRPAPLVVIRRRTLTRGRDGAKADPRHQRVKSVRAGNLN